MATFFPYCGSPIIPIKLVAALAIGLSYIATKYKITVSTILIILITSYKFINNMLL